ncbi:MAG: hypothetical protein ACPMAQ_06530, partial [Phycisphaerae bacterium]
MDANTPRDTHDSAPQPLSGADRQDEKTPPVRRQRRRWRRRLAIVLAALVAIVAAAPWLASTATATRMIVSAVNDRLVGKVGLRKLSLSWSGPLTLTGIEVSDAQGRKVLTADAVSCTAGLWHAIRSPTRFRQVTIEAARTSLFVDEHNEISLVQALSLRKSPPPDKSTTLPPLTGRIVIHNAAVHLAPAGRPTYDVSGINLNADLDTLSRIAGTMTAKLPAGAGLEGEWTIDGLAADGRFRPLDASGKLKIRTTGDANLGGLLPVFLRGVQATGKASVNIEAAAVSGKATVNLRTRLSDLRIARPGAVEVKPTDLTVAAQLTATRDLAFGDAELTGPPGRAQMSFRYAPSGGPVSVSADRVVSAALTGESITLPDFELKASSSLDLATLAQSIPGVLRIRPGVTVTSGSLAIDNLVIRGGGQPMLNGAIALTQLTTTKAGGTTPWDPIAIRVDARLEEKTGLILRTARVEAGFANLTASGSARALHADLKTDLTRLHRQVNEILEIGLPDVSGQLSAAIETGRGATQHVTVACDATGTDLTYRTGDGEARIARAALRQTGELVLADSKAVKYSAKGFDIDLDGKALAAGSGWFDMAANTFHADLDLKQADLAYLGSKAAAFGVKDLARYGGTGRFQLKVDRASGNGPIVADGRVVVQNAAADGEPLTEKDIVLQWSALRIVPAPARITVATAELQSAPARATVKDARLDLGTAFSAAGKLNADADLSQCLAIAGRITQGRRGLQTPTTALSQTPTAALPQTPTATPPKIAGRLIASVSCTSSADSVGVAGSCRVDSLEIGAGRETVRQKQADLSCDAIVDRKQKVLRLRRIQLASGLLNAQISGTVSDYSNACLLDLSGTYEGTWDTITPLIHELAPATRDTLSLTGPTAGAFTVRGPARQAGAVPEYRGVSSAVKVSWTSAQAYGASLGAASLSPALRDGTIDIPLTEIPASGGQARLGGTIDLRTAEPTYRLAGNVVVLKDVRITPQLGRHLLGRVNPIFAHLAAVEGKVSLSLKDVALPLGEEIKRRGAGQGHLDLADLKIRPAGFSALLLELGGLGGPDMQAVTVNGVDFIMKDGRVVYQNMQINFPNDFDLIFRGSVGFDDTMEMWVSVPVKPALLAKFGVRGPLQEYANSLA